jgi:formylglycine-generating enzyme required for sulfatase activity
LSNSVVAIGLVLVGLAAAAGGVVLVVRVAALEHEAPARCGKGLQAVLSRCCAPGQAVARGRCVGEPSSCPAGMHLADSRSGCVIDPRRIVLAGGRVSLGTDDWQAEGVVRPRSALVAPFALDGAEVTAERWGHCVRAGACRAVDEPEAGAPVTGVGPKEAERFCRFENGRLPTGDEWLMAAMGAEGRRFPWGATGLVCRRAVFGMKTGPCAHGGGPELAGARPDGATPDGVQDLAGNVAEWTTEQDGSHVARGGSFRAEAALELESWAAETASPTARHVGLRCAYDRAAAGPGVR